MSVNADGTFLMGQATARAMVKQPPSALLGRRGLIVNISSAAQKWAADPCRVRGEQGGGQAPHVTQALALKNHAIAACVVYPVK